MKGLTSVQAQKHHIEQTKQQYLFHYLAFQLLLSGSVGNVIPGILSVLKQVDDMYSR